eukprot:10007685-Karenia_brevis.AAC.1
MSASCIQSGLEALDVLSPAIAEYALEHEDVMKRTGLLQYMQRSPDTLEADVAEVNIYTGQGEDEESHKESVIRLLTHYGEKDTAADRMIEYATLADFGYRLYLMACASMDLTAEASDMTAWAEKIPPENQPKDVLKFIKNPTVKNLAKAVAKENAPRARRTGETPRVGIQTPRTAALDDDSTSSSGDKKGKRRRNKKSKKEKRPRRKQDSASACASSDSEWTSHCKAQAPKKDKK